MNKVCNEEVKVPNGIDLNEKDYCICLLSTLKDMEKNYVIAMTEASNEWLWGIYRDIFQEISLLQRKLYILMFQNGWYQLENVDSKKINDKYQSFNQDYQGLSQ